MTGHRVISDRGVVSKMAFDTAWVSASGVSIDGWCWWRWTVHSWYGSQVLPSPMVVDEQFGFSWGLTTKTRQILRFQGGSGGLAIWGKLFPLGSTGDKVSQSWEVFTRTCWRGRSYWLIWLALSCFVGIYIFCCDIVSYIVSTSMISIIRPVCGKSPSLGDLQAFLRFGVSISDQPNAGIIFSPRLFCNRKNTGAESLRYLFA